MFISSVGGGWRSGVLLFFVSFVSCYRRPKETGRLRVVGIRLKSIAGLGLERQAGREWPEPGWGYRRVAELSDRSLRTALGRPKTCFVRQNSSCRTLLPSPAVILKMSAEGLPVGTARHARFLRLAEQALLASQLRDAGQSLRGSPPPTLSPHLLRPSSGSCTA